MHRSFVGNTGQATHKALDWRIETSVTKIVNLAWNKCQIVVAFGLLSLQGVAELHAQQSPRTVAQLAGLIEDRISEIEKNATLESAVETPVSLAEELDELKQRSVMLFGEHRKR